jgi:hypothetical protein
MNIKKISFKNNYIFEKEIDITGLRYPKFFIDENINLFGSKIYKKEQNISKYLLVHIILDNNFELIEEKIIDLSNIFEDYYNNIYLSSWVRNIYRLDEYNYMNVEIKKNINNNNFMHNNYLIRTIDFINFTVVKKYNNNDDFIFMEHKNITFSSKIIHVVNNFWGKYLFNIKIDEKIVIPLFDKIIDYDLVITNNQIELDKDKFIAFKTKKIFELFNINYNK